MPISSCSDNTNNTSHSANNTEPPRAGYYINFEDRGLTYSDFDEVYLMCKSFLEEFYKAAISGSAMNLEPYLNNNDNLKKYIPKKIEAGSPRSDNEIKKLIFGLVDIEWYLDKDYVFVEMTAEVQQGFGGVIGGFGENHQFLISNKDGNLVISDWYSKSAGNVSLLDEFVRGNFEEINDPNIWHDQEWVDNLFQIIDDRSQWKVPGQQTG